MTFKDRLTAEHLEWAYQALLVFQWISHSKKFTNWSSLSNIKPCFLKKKKEKMTHMRTPNMDNTNAHTYLCPPPKQLLSRLPQTLRKDVSLRNNLYKSNSWLGENKIQLCLMAPLWLLEKSLHASWVWEKAQPWAQPPWPALPPSLQTYLFIHGSLKPRRMLKTSLGNWYSLIGHS